MEGAAGAMACIAGAIAEAYYGEMPQYIIGETRKRLCPKPIEVLDAFENCISRGVSEGNEQE